MPADASTMREAEIARAVFDAEEIPRQPSLRRQHDDAGRVRELLRFLVPGVTEAGGLCQPLDRRLVAGQEMPARAGARLLVALEVDRLLRGRGCGRIARVEADGDDLEVLARVERQHAERARQAVDDLRAQHRTVVVGEHHHHRPLAEVVGEPDGAPGLVAEGGVERDVLIDVLIEANPLQRLRHRRGHHPGFLLVSRALGAVAICADARRTKNTEDTKDTKDTRKTPLHLRSDPLAAFVSSVPCVSFVMASDRRR